MTTPAVPEAGTLPWLDRYTSTSGEIMTEVGVTQAQLLEFGREWERRCWPILAEEVETLRAEVARLEAEAGEACPAEIAAKADLDQARADLAALHAEAARLRAALDLAERDKAHVIVDLGESKAGQLAARMLVESEADRADRLAEDLHALQRAMAGQAALIQAQDAELDAMRPVVEAATAYVAAWHKLYRYPNQTPSSRPDLGDLADSQHATRNALIAAVDQMAPSGPLSVRQGDDRGAVAVTATDTVEAQGAAQGAAHACRCGGLDPIHGSSDV